MLFRLLFLLFLLLPLKTEASVPEGAVIQDAEIEATLKSYVQPIFKVAGLNPKSLTIYIIHTQEVNAFAMAGGSLAVTTGLLLKAKSALQLIGVLAHETAHIAGNHVVRGAEAYEKALMQMILGTVGGVAAGIAGSPEAAMALILGSQEVAKSHFLKFSRTQESSADQGAARFLDKLGYSSEGLLEFMQILHKDDLLAEQFIDPYAITHPLHTERIDFFRAHLNRSPHREGKLPKEFDDNFARMQMKLSAFTADPNEILALFKQKADSLLSCYGRAIAYFRNIQTEESLKEINDLLQKFPQDPYFWELKGQILFESGKIQDSAKAYEQAVKLRPDIPYFRLSLAQSLIEGGDESHLERAHRELLRAKTEEPDSPSTYRLLAVYYGKRGKIDLAALSLAEMSLCAGDLKTAEEQAKRSLHLLKNDPVNEARAKDILEEVKRLKESEKDFF